VQDTCIGFASVFSDAFETSQRCLHVFCCSDTKTASAVRIQKSESTSANVRKWFAVSIQKSEWTSANVRKWAKTALWAAMFQKQQAEDDMKDVVINIDGGACLLVRAGRANRSVRLRSAGYRRHSLSVSEMSLFVVS
jgi:hypothetical protein